MIKFVVSDHLIRDSSLLISATEVFKLHVQNVHCKHIIFGGSADNGYARMLGPYAGIEMISKRITMLKGPPLAEELSRLAHNFTTISFTEVFRTVKLPERRVSFSAPSPNSNSPRPATWASTVTATPTPSAGNPLRQEAAPMVEPGTGSIARNALGQRVDPPLNISQPLVVTLKKEKLCNNWHLTNSCPYPQCKHKHGEKLKGKDLNTLRYVARLAACDWGLECNDPDCFRGHRCLKTNCDGSGCQFAYRMHDVDTRIVGYQRSAM